MHDPRVGRFFARDPLENKYPYLTPYQFSSNNPIGMKEIEGLEGVKYSEYGADGKLIRHIIKLKVMVVTVDEIDKSIKENLISTLGERDGTKKWRQIKGDRITSNYTSSDVQTIYSTLNSSYNGSDGKGSKNSKGELVYFDLDVQELKVKSTDLGSKAEIVSKARLVDGILSSEPLPSPIIINNKGDVLQNKMSPAALITGAYAGGAKGDNNQVLTRINEGNGLDNTTINHEIGHQLMTLPGEGEHDLMSEFEFNLTPKVIDQMLNDAYKINPPSNNKTTK